MLKTEKENNIDNNKMKKKTMTKANDYKMLSKSDKKR